MDILGRRTAGSVELQNNSELITRLYTNPPSMSLGYARLALCRESAHANASVDPISSHTNKFNSTVNTPVVVKSSDSTPPLGKAHVEDFDIVKTEFPVEWVAWG